MRGADDIRALRADERRTGAATQRLDWIAFVLLLVGALAWGAFVTDVNVLDRVLEPIADPLDDTVFMLIAAAGLYWLVRVVAEGRGTRRR